MGSNQLAPSAPTPYSPFGVAHAAAAALALLGGAYVLATRKGTRTHVRAGWVYVACMLYVNVSALAIRHLTGRFNFFHALALVSLAMVLGGVAQVVFRRRIRRWAWRHYQYMCWPYAGLVAGAVNEAFARVPPLRHLSESAGGVPVLAASATVLAAAAALIFANQCRILSPFQPVAGQSPTA
jgi:uncharacterized membrane protein